MVMDTHEGYDITQRAMDTHDWYGCKEGYGYRRGIWIHKGDTDISTDTFHSVDYSFISVEFISFDRHIHQTADLPSAYLSF